MRTCLNAHGWEKNSSGLRLAQRPSGNSPCMTNTGEDAKVKTADTWPSAAPAGVPLLKNPPADAPLSAETAPSDTAVFDTALADTAVFDTGVFDRTLFDAILFDRDGTLVLDEPYNSDPELVIPVPGAVATVAAARRAGLRTGVLTNQSGIARGLLTVLQVQAVNRRVDDLFGAFDVWEFCPHEPDSGCRCRKPAPGMIFDACSKLGIAPSRTAYIGDIGSDMGAARASGATGVLVPTAVTLPEEVAQAALVAEDLGAALQLLLGPSGSPR